VIYLLVFLGSLGVDLVPVVAPPAWTLMAFLLVKYRLNPWAVLAVGVPGSALGRYIFSLYIPKFSDKFIARKKKEELKYVGKRLDQSVWRTWTFVFVYTLTPLSTTALFTAAGMTKVALRREQRRQPAARRRQSEGPDHRRDDARRDGRVPLH
jgi:membrane protein YqaA with SNARE-associated domain